MNWMIVKSFQEDYTVMIHLDRVQIL